MDHSHQNAAAFAGMRKIAHGPLVDVALAVKAAAGTTDHAMILIFDDASGKVLDLDLRGSAGEIVARLTGETGHPMAAGADGRTEEAPRGRGRPKLGVVPREVTLLPRHWEWLSAQPGGASQVLRRLVDQARQADGGRTEAKQAQERAYRFMSALAGDLPGFEEAARALFRSDTAKLTIEMAVWPEDVRNYVLTLADTGRQPGQFTDGDGQLSATDDDAT